MEYENKEVKLYEDGTYRWVYEMNMITNPTIFLTVLKVFFWIIVGMWAVFGLILYVSHGDWKGFLGMTKAMLIVLGLFTVLTLLGVLLLAAIYASCPGRSRRRRRWDCSPPWSRLPRSGPRRPARACSPRPRPVRSRSSRRCVASRRTAGCT